MPSSAVINKTILYSNYRRTIGGPRLPDLMCKTTIGKLRRKSKNPKKKNKERTHYNMMSNFGHPFALEISYFFLICTWVIYCKKKVSAISIFHFFLYLLPTESKLCLIQHWWYSKISQLPTNTRVSLVKQDKLRWPERSVSGSKIAESR